MTNSVITTGLIILVSSLLGTSLGEKKTIGQEKDGAEEVTICRLKNDPGAYNRKLVRVTGFVSHGFEDFGLYDPTCPEWPQIWLEYGGTRSSDTMYCCGVTPKQQRSSDVSVENIKIPLVRDDQFDLFDKIIETERDSTIHATVIGRFFSGREIKYPNGKTGWSGYGHMGCCSLLVIQQVADIGLHNRSDLDYRSSPDQPNLNKVGCGYRDLVDDWRFNEALVLQRKAESGKRAWAFDDPARVAKELLVHEAGVPESSIVNLKVARTAAGRIVYTWRPSKSKSSYMIVVSRPFTLSFYATDPQRVAWVPIAAYRVGCENDNSVRRIK